MYRAVSTNTLTFASKEILGVVLKRRMYMQRGPG